MKLKNTVFHIPDLDCPSEEQAIRLALLGDKGIKQLSVDYLKRELTLLHIVDLQVEQIAAKIPFRQKVVSSSVVDQVAGDTNNQAPSSSTSEQHVLLYLLGLNFGMFIVELWVGMSADSSSLVADGLDMLADAFVYLLSLTSIHLGLSARIRATRMSAYLQGGLGILALIQAGWRFLYGSDPEPEWMSGISVLALSVNIICLILISRFRSGRMHMQASWIFSSNDVIANIAVIVAGVFVAWTGSRYPDLFVGAGICLLVLHGAVKIRKLAVSPEN